MIYMKGVGLEALETCESFFSKSNALASTTRYATRFHRQQAITTYLKHADQFDTYQGLSKCSASSICTQINFIPSAGSLQQIQACPRDQGDSYLPARRDAGTRCPVARRV
jgi:hypothetical protein